MVGVSSRKPKAVRVARRQLTIILPCLSAHAQQTFSQETQLARKRTRTLSLCVWALAFLVDLALHVFGFCWKLDAAEPCRAHCEIRTWCTTWHACVRETLTPVDQVPHRREVHAAQLLGLLLVSYFAASCERRPEGRGLPLLFERCPTYALGAPCCARHAAAIRRRSPASRAANA